MTNYSSKADMSYVEVKILTRNPINLNLEWFLKKGAMWHFVYTTDSFNSIYKFRTRDIPYHSQIFMPTLSIDGKEDNWNQYNARTYSGWFLGFPWGDLISTTKGTLVSTMDRVNTIHYPPHIGGICQQIVCGLKGRAGMQIGLGVAADVQFVLLYRSWYRSTVMEGFTCAD